MMTLHNNLVVYAPIIMKFGTSIHNGNKKFVLSRLLCSYDVITGIYASA